MVITNIFIQCCLHRRQFQVQISRIEMLHNWNQVEHIPAFFIFVLYVLWKLYIMEIISRWVYRYIACMEEEDSFICQLILNRTPLLT